MKDTEVEFIQKMMTKMDDISVSIVNNMDKETFKQYTISLTDLIEKTNPLTLTVEIGARQMPDYGGSKTHLVGFKFTYEKPRSIVRDDD